MSRQPARASSGRYVSRLTGGTLAIIMAGGRGERLRDLTEHRCKPATPFGGKFRIVDFVLSNCVNSGIRQISILTQYKAQSLIQHVQHGWSYLRGEFGEFVEVVPAQQQLGPDWYRGTADAVHQNLELILAHHPKHVLVLAGDHIYKMDYGPMIAYHVEKGADITVGVVEVPARESRHFGVLTATEWNRVTRFAEKPAQPDMLPGRPDSDPRLDGHLRLQHPAAAEACWPRMPPTRLPPTTSARTSCPRPSTATCRCSPIRSRT